ncbi:peptide chain release factor N(5)-glutamine methyltransferase [Undibacterium sp. TJN25]|uniref:peptide chain release factor N(5)-glutamine methyltransferase n=1 Tax=Undibacterium sp. TJN25 TaxID=3413056 RepID=UPI003BF31BD0
MGSAANGITIAACEAASPLDKLETRILMMHALGLTRIQLITRSEQVLAAEQLNALQNLIQRRVAGEPIAYITGEREFYGLSFTVTPDVLIPRPDTELLVELALQYAPQNGNLLDMGTGSGAIAIAVAHQRADLQVTALDVSEAALSVAHSNAQKILGQHSPRLRLLQSDWYGALAEQRFHTIASNPPYIVKNDRHLGEGDLRFEPVNALTDHGDGLSAYRTIIGGAAGHLHADGWLLMEHGYDQAEAVRGLLTLQGFTQVQSWRDLAGIERVSGGVLSTAS